MLGIYAGKKVFWDVRVIEVEEKGAPGLGSMSSMGAQNSYFESMNKIFKHIQTGPFSKQKYAKMVI